MEKNPQPVKEPIQAAAQAAQTVRGAVKVGKAIAATAKGAAAGGYIGAIVAFAWANRKLIAKIIAATILLLAIPVIMLCMLPSVIFGGYGDTGAEDTDISIINNADAIEDNLREISNIVSTSLSTGLSQTLQAIEADFTASGADGKEVENTYEGSLNFNANLFVGQYCAANDADYTSISIPHMEAILSQNTGKLYTYTKKDNYRTVEKTEIVETVDPDTGEIIQEEVVTTVTEHWILYTVVYNGEAYFADEIFHLTDAQKDLSDDYAQNLSLFLGDSMFQSLPDGYQTIASLGIIRFTDGQTPVVYYNQKDERYANQPFGKDNIGGYGCGPTAMAIVVSSLTANTVDPIQMARWAYEHGYWCSKSGSYHSLIPGAAKAWGLPVEGCSAKEGQRIVDALANGKLVVALMLKGHFTNSGHFIVLRGVKDGKILVADPASYDRSKMEWDLSIILNEASTRAGAGGPFWIIG